MWYCIKFKVPDEKEYLLYDDGSFIGTEFLEKAHEIIRARVIADISVCFQVVKIANARDLEHIIGGVPYKILNFSNGLVFWEGVEIKNQGELWANEKDNSNPA